VHLLRGNVPSEDEEKMDETSPPLPKKQPLSLEDMIAKKEAETQAQAKVLLHHCCGIYCIAQNTGELIPETILVDKILVTAPKNEISKEMIPLVKIFGR